jgi:hypothetical protein
MLLLVIFVSSDSVVVADFGDVCILVDSVACAASCEASYLEDCLVPAALPPPPPASGDESAKSLLSSPLEPSATAEVSNLAD